MKTTVEIAEPLLQEARRVAAKQGVTLRALIEQGLRRVVSEDRPAANFKLRPASFKGAGLQADVQDASWDEIRRRAYEGRGG